MDKKGKLSANDTIGKEIMGKISEFFTDHSAQDANAIYNVYNDRPLQTSITNSIKEAMRNFTANIGKE